MKTFVLFLAIAGSSAAQEFGDDHPSRKWLPIPDGFVWPKDADDAPEFKTDSRKFASLPEGQRDAILNHWPEDTEPEGVTLAEVDLNGDERPELFVGIPAYSGSGGIFFEIFSSADRKTYRAIGGVQGWGFRFLKK